MKLCMYFLQAWLTHHNPSFKQSRCSITDNGGVCKLASDKKKRVTFSVSAFIFKTHAVHVPVGAGIVHNR